MLAEDHILPQVNRWHRSWLVATGVAAILATVADAVLLQRKLGFLTGGFLAVDYVRTTPQAVAFIVCSLLVDAAAIGALAALMLWMAARLEWPRGVAVIAAIVGGLAPIAIADVITYQVFTFLGDAFDFWLMFGLAGKNPAEILAVSSGHLLQIAPVLFAGIVIVAVALWLLKRYQSAKTATTLGGIAFRRSLAYAVLMVLFGVSVTFIARSFSQVLDFGIRWKPAGALFSAVIGRTTDFDRDGYGILGRPGDSAPFDARIHPWAVDTPGDGVDEDGVGGDLPIGPAYSESTNPAPAWPSTPNVILILLESFRADAQGAMLNGKPVTPVLDALARHGVSTHVAYSHNGYTVESRHHVFSGSVAGLRGPSTLLDDFKAAGYETAYFSGQDDSFGAPEFRVGFERADVAYDARSDRERRYTTFATPGSLAVSHKVLTERVEAFLHTRRADRPLFLYINFHDTHFPYTHREIAPIIDRTMVAASEIAPTRKDDLRSMYLNTAANVDRAIGEVMAAARRALGSDPAVIVLSDHGESLYDDGLLGHGFALNDTQTRIPFIAANLPIAIEEPFAQADLRDAVRAALVQRSPDAQPTVTRNDSRRVFQYLGPIDRPAAIALAGLNGRTIYDFRSDRAMVSGGAWQRLDALPPAEHDATLELIRTWERMMVARQAAGLD